MAILIDETTTFIVQGITGREAVNLTRECLDYGAGARIVGGVTPGRRGRDIHGVPVFDTMDIITAILSTPGFWSTSLANPHALRTLGLPPISQ